MMKSGADIFGNQEEKKVERSPAVMKLSSGASNENYKMTLEAMLSKGRGATHMPNLKPAAPKQKIQMDLYDLAEDERMEKLSQDKTD